jgi:hypothetical protein
VYTTLSTRALATLGAGLLLAAGCAGPATSPGADTTRRAPDVPSLVPASLAVPSSSPGIRGTITVVQSGDSLVAQTPGTGAPNAPTSCPPGCGMAGRPLRAVRVEEVPGEGTGGDKSVVTVPAGARLLRRVGGDVIAIGFGDLRTGQRASVWYDGPVRESYPTQGSAGVVLVSDP